MPPPFRSQLQAWPPGLRSVRRGYGICAGVAVSFDLPFFERALLKGEFFFLRPLEIFLLSDVFEREK